LDSLPDFNSVPLSFESILAKAGDTLRHILVAIESTPILAGAKAGGEICDSPRKRPKRSDECKTPGGPIRPRRLLFGLRLI
jgi:hypothetical protein